jgi:ABC-type Fe3+ transport system permease subunit
VTAAVLFPRRPPRAEVASAAEAGLARPWSRVACLASWLGAAFVTALPQNGINAPVSMLFINEHEAPGPLRSIDSADLGWLTVGHTMLLGVTVAVVCMAVGCTIFVGVMPRTFLALSMVIAAQTAGRRHSGSWYPLI